MTSTLLDTFDPGDMAGSTRWVRAVAAMMLGFLGIVGFWSLIRTNVLATYFVINNEASPMAFNTNMLAGNYVGFSVVPANVGGTQKSVLRASFAVASLDGICVSKQETIAGVSMWFTLKAGNGVANNGTNGNGIYIGSGSGDTDPVSGLKFPFKDIEATNMIFDVTSITTGNSTQPAGLTLGGMDQIGLAGPDIATEKSGGVYVSNPLGAPTANNGYGWTGTQGTYGSLNQLKGTLVASEIQNLLAMPNLKITVSPTGTSCNAASASFTN